MPRHQMSDAEWEYLRSLLPDERPRRRGRPWRSHRLLLDAIFWILATGSPWRDLPTEYQPWQTAYDRFARWQADGTWDALVEALQGALLAGGHLDLDLWCIDGSILRAHKAAAGAATVYDHPDEPDDHALGRSQGGFGTKAHIVTDGRGTALGVVLTPGQRHECTQVDHALDTVPLGLQARRLAGDKGYSYPSLRRRLLERGMEAVIPTRKDQPRDEAFDQDAYRRRSVIEQCIGWLKEMRRVATRYEKLAVRFLAMIQLAMIQRYFKLLLSDRA